MSMIKAVREFMCSCPLLNDGRLNVDYLGSEPREYVIERKESDEVIREYADGGKLKRFDFLFGSREWIAKSVDEQMEIAAFYENVALWLSEKTKKGELPVLFEDRVAQSIYAKSAGRKKDHAGDSAKYQMECSLIYYEGGR